MTVAAFLEWASRRPEGERWELIEGAPVPVRGTTPAQAMAAETVIHARIKRRIDHTRARRSLTPASRARSSCPGRKSRSTPRAPSSPTWW